MKNKKLFIVLGILVVVFALFMSNPFGSDSNKSTYTQLSGSEFTETYQSTPDAVLIDVRTPEEFNGGHIEGALNIDFQNQSFLSEIQKLDLNKPYFVYCRSGNRSGQAISIMQNAGITTIYELDGGISSQGDSLDLVTTSNAEFDYAIDSSDYVNGQELISGIEKSELSDVEKVGLIQMREEEKLARDVYARLGELWGTQIFSNIAKSEQTHTDAVKVLLDRYGITDPVMNNTAGVFTSTTMQELYDNLVDKGKTSLLDALIVGATVEDLDIKDLNILKAETIKEDILVTYNNLQRGSRNHLRAFVKNIEAKGGSYSPQFISESEYQSIISSEQEKGKQ